MLKAYKTRVFISSRGEKDEDTIDFTKRGSEGGVYVCSTLYESNNIHILSIGATLYTHVGDKTLEYHYEYRLSDDKTYYDLVRMYYGKSTTVTGARLTTRLEFKNAEQNIAVRTNRQEFPGFDPKTVKTEGMFTMAIPIGVDYDIVSVSGIAFRKVDTPEQFNTYNKLLGKLFDKTQVKDLNQTISELWEEEVKYGFRDIGARFLNSCLNLHIILAILDRLGKTVLEFERVYTPTNRINRQLDELDNELKDKGVHLLKRIIIRYHMYN